MNCKYCGEVIIPCPKQPCGLGEYLHGESGMHRCNQGLTATPAPVAPAPTASARESMDRIVEQLDGTPIYTLDELHAKLEGIGQEAAEKIADLVDGALQGEEIELNRGMVAAIIDELIAGRLKP